MAGPPSAHVAPPTRIVGRYALFDEIASGGMAAVHIGRMVGAAGFSRTVAIKKLHPHYAKDPEFRAMLVDEARVASCIRHPNVVATLDVVSDGDDLLLVMEYVPAESLAGLLRLLTKRGERVPARVAASIAVQLLHGLHAAHEATNEAGEPLGIVHRDVSPQNVLVGGDGVVRVIDFGVAKAVGRMQTTREGVLKGKLPYMSPEQLGGREIDRRCDVYAASVVLWETLTGTRLFAGGDDGSTYGRIMRGASVPPSRAAAGVPVDLDGVVMRGLAVEPDARFPTARDMAKAIEGATATATATQIGEWVESVAAELLARRKESVGRVESGSHASHVQAKAEPPEVPTSGTMSLRSNRDVRSSRRARLATAASVLVGLVAGAALWWRSPRASAVAPAASAEAIASSPAAPASAPAPAPAPPPASASAPAPAPRPSPRRATPPRSPARAPNCSPPYYFDPDGTKHYKKECV